MYIHDNHDFSTYLDKIFFQFFVNRFRYVLTEALFYFFLKKNLRLMKIKVKRFTSNLMQAMLLRLAYVSTLMSRPELCKSKRSHYLLLIFPISCKCKMLITVGC